MTQGLTPLIGITADTTGSVEDSKENPERRLFLFQRYVTAIEAAGDPLPSPALAHEELGTFTLTGVPSGQSGLFLFYTITAGPNASGTVHKVALAATATPGNFAATVGGFTMGNTISV